MCRRRSRRRVPNVGGAGVAVGAAQRDRAGTGLREVAAAADGAGAEGDVGCAVGVEGGVFAERDGAGERAGAGGDVRAERGGARAGIGDRDGTADRDTAGANQQGRVIRAGAAVVDRDGTGGAAERAGGTAGGVGVELDGALADCRCARVGVGAGKIERAGTGLGDAEGAPGDDRTDAQVLGRRAAVTDRESAAGAEGEFAGNRAAIGVVRRVVGDVAAERERAGRAGNGGGRAAGAATEIEGADRVGAAVVIERAAEDIDRGSG